MARRNFSLPDHVMAWLVRGAEREGMRVSTHLAYLLKKLMEQEEPAE